MAKVYINKIADLLGWSDQETRAAVEEYIVEKSIVEPGDILNILTKADGPKSRFELTSKFLISNSKYKPIDIIERLSFNVDPCFYALAVFNYYSLKNKISDRISWDLHKTKSFINWDFAGDIHTSYINYYSTKYDKRLLPTTLQDQYLDILVNKMIKEDKVKKDELICEIASRVGFLAFNIEAFRNHVSNYIYDPSQRDKAVEIIKSISNPLDYIDSTNKKHWLYFVLVEKLREDKECKARESFFYISQMLFVPETTISRRYYEKLEIFQRKNITIDEIISEKNLNKITIKHYMDKFEQSKDELKNKRKSHLKRTRTKTKKY